MQISVAADARQAAGQGDWLHAAGMAPALTRE